jgi:glycosyltransferase involved in cell wall biosynthesis
MKPRLAVVLSHPIPNFAAWHRAVAEAGEIDLKVLFCCDWGTEEYVDPQFGQAVRWDVPLLEGYAHEMLPIRRRPEKLRFREVDNPRVGEALARFAPDVVQVFGYAHRTNWRAVGWARRRGKPVLLFSDSNVQQEPTGWKRLAKRAVVGAFYRRVDGALYVGENNRQYHRHYGLPPERLFRGTLPIDRERLLAGVPDPAAARAEVRARHGIPQGACVAVLCGKYVAHKRPADLLAAVARAGGRPLWALLVGEGPERGALEALCRREGIANATLTGFVNQSAVGSYLAASDLFVLPSSTEAYGLAVTEACAFGLPLLVSDRVGCIGEADVAQPGRNARIFPCGDVAALAAQLEDLCRHPETREAMARESARIAECHDVRFAARALGEAVARLGAMGPR